MYEANIIAKQLIENKELRDENEILKNELLLEKETKEMSINSLMKAFRKLQAKEKLHIKIIMELTTVIEKDLLPSLKLLYSCGGESHSPEETNELLKEHDKIVKFAKKIN